MVRSVEIVFSPQDAAVARRLQRFLSAFRTPKRLVGRPCSLGPVPDRLALWLSDTSTERVTASFVPGNPEPIQHSESLVVICSPHSATSVFVNERIKAFKSLGRAERILCMIVEGEPNATEKGGASAAQECFSHALRFAVGPDGEFSETPAEPVAADARYGRDGWHDACLKIAAGITGIGYDELKQRALQRRLRMFAMAAAVVGVILLMTLVLTVVALAHLRIASAQRVEAVIARRRAEQSLASAELARGVAEARSRQAKAMLDGQRSALALIRTGTGSLSGLGVRAMDVIAWVQGEANKSSQPVPRFQDAASLLAFAQSMIALRQPAHALDALDSALEILMRLPTDDSQVAPILPVLRGDVEAERVATLLVLGRLDDADESIKHLRHNNVETIAANEDLSLRMDLIAAELAIGQNHLEEAARAYEILADHSRNGTDRPIWLQTKTAIGRTRVAIRRGDWDGARACLAHLSTLDLPGQSRQGTLHDLYSELAAATAAAGDHRAAIAVLEESLAVAAKINGSVPVTLVPQLLMAADLATSETASNKYGYHDQALAICIDSLNGLFEPGTTEQIMTNFLHIALAYDYVSQEYLVPLLTRCATADYLTAFGPDRFVSLLRTYESFSAFIHHNAVELRKQAGVTPDLKRSVDQIVNCFSKQSQWLAAQIPPLLSAADAIGPPKRLEATVSRTATITNSIGMILAPIEPGEFLMGSPANEPLGNELEELLHPVVITRPFLMGAYEVTQAQFIAVRRHNPSVFRGENMPVEHVPWSEAVAFCEALSQLPAERKARRRYRLPTEAEWEYCCRADTTTPYHTGKSLLPTQARYAFCDRVEPKSPAPVGSYPPNNWGLHDMHGNVWEWTNDWFSATYFASIPRAIDPTGPANGTHHVLRGGSASVLPTECHSAIRGEAFADRPSDKSTDSRYAILGDFGFRVVCEILTAEPNGAMGATAP